MRGSTSWRLGLPWPCSLLLTASRAGVGAGQTPSLAPSPCGWRCPQHPHPDALQSPHHTPQGCLYSQVFWFFFFFFLTDVLLPLPLHPPRFPLWGPGWQLSASPRLRPRHAITGPQPLGSGCHLERETRFTQGLFLGQASQPRARPYQAQASSPEEGLQARAPSSGCQTAWQTQTYSLVLRWKEKWGAV